MIKIKRNSDLIRNLFDTLREETFLKKDNQTTNKDYIVGLHRLIKNENDDSIVLLEVADNQERSLFKQRNTNFAQESLCKTFFITGNKRLDLNIVYNVYLVYDYFPAIRRVLDKVSLRKEPYFEKSRPYLEEFIAKHDKTREIIRKEEVRPDSSSNLKDTRSRICFNDISTKSSVYNAVFFIESSSYLSLYEVVPDTIMLAKTKRTFDNQKYIISKDYIDGFTTVKDPKKILGVILTSDSLIIIEIISPLAKKTSLNFGSIESIRILKFIKVASIIIHKRDCSCGQVNASTASSTISYSSGLGSSDDITSEASSLEFDLPESAHTRPLSNQSLTELSSENILVFTCLDQAGLFQITFSSSHLCDKWKVILDQQKNFVLNTLSESNTTVVNWNMKRGEKMSITLTPAMTCKDIKRMLKLQANVRLYVRFLDEKHSLKRLDDCDTPLGYVYENRSFEIHLTDSHTPILEIKAKKQKRFFVNFMTASTKNISQISNYSMFGRQPMELWNVDTISNSLIVLFYIVSYYGPRQIHIFRKSSQKKIIDDLSKLLDDDVQKEYCVAEFMPIHCACILKKYFKEIPGGILADYQFNFARDCKQSLYSDEINQLLQGLHPVNKQILVLLLYTLRRIIENSDFNYMTSSNLAIVWAPNLLNVTKTNVNDSIFFIDCLFNSGLGCVEREYLERVEEYFDKITDLVTIPENFQAFTIDSARSDSDIPTAEQLEFVKSPPVYRRACKNQSFLTQKPELRVREPTPNKNPITRDLESFRKQSKATYLNNNIIRMKSNSRVRRNSSVDTLTLHRDKIKRGPSQISNRSSGSNTLVDNDYNSDAESI